LYSIIRLIKLALRLSAGVDLVATDGTVELSKRLGTVEVGASRTNDRIWKIARQMRYLRFASSRGKQVSRGKQGGVIIKNMVQSSGDV
jgi:hypothetical protein